MDVMIILLKIGAETIVDFYFMVYEIGTFCYY